MLMSECRVGMQVTFGRTNGQKTTGVVIKMNRCKAKVKTLEGRGYRHQAGVEWNVPYSMMTACYTDTPKAPAFHVNAGTGRLPMPEYSPTLPQEDVLLLEAMLRCYAELSPENLTCDGELSQSQVRERSAVLNRKLTGLFLAYGRKVDEAEAYAFAASKRKYQRQKLEKLGIDPDEQGPGLREVG